MAKETRKTEITVHLVEEIARRLVAKAIAAIPPGGGGGMEIHNNDYHDPDYATPANISTAVSTHAGIANAHHSNANDPNSDQKSALSGTSGTPSATNKYVTNDDSRNTDTRTPIDHASSHVSTGGDAIADAVSSGASGLMSGDDKAKLDALQGQLQADWNQADSLQIDYIKNKPSIPTQYTDEMAQDASASMITGATHSGVSVAYDDVGNKLAFTVTAAGYSDEQAQDATAAMIAAGTHTAVGFTYDDATNKMSAAVQFGTSGTTACVGNDARLSDARTPTTHQHAALRQTITQAGLGSVGECIYRTSGAYAKSKADTEATAELYGIIESVNGDDHVVVLPGGIISGLSGLTDGAIYFLSPDTAGAMTPTEPTAPNIKKPVLFATSTTGGQVLCMPGFVQTEEIALGMADVRLVRTDTNTITLTGMPGTGKLIEVNGEAVDLSSDKTIDTDSASHFIIIGTTSVSKSTALNSYTGNGSDGNAYNAYGLFHVYVCNSNACWNFASYDRRGSTILSPNAPTTDGCLAASDDGLNARHVGAIKCNASRLMENSLCLLSIFHRQSVTYTLESGGTYNAITPNTGFQDLPGAYCQIHCVLPKDVAIYVSAHAGFWNDDIDIADIAAQIWYGNSGGTPINSSFEAENLANFIYGYRRYTDLAPKATLTESAIAAHLVKLRIHPGTNNASSPFVYTVTCDLTVSYGEMY